MPAQTFTTGQILTAAQMNALSAQAYANTVPPPPEIIIPTSGQSLTLSSTSLWHQLRPAAALTSLTLTMPATPGDQLTHQITSTQDIESLTVLANAGQTLLGPPSAIAQNGSVSWRYDASSTTWVRAG